MMDAVILKMAPAPAEVRYQIGGWWYRAAVWSLDDWDRLPEALRPLQACSLGANGWILLERVDNQDHA